MLKKAYKIISVALLICLCFIGCAKVIRTESSTVQATVVDVDYRPAYITPMMCGKTMTVINHPAHYSVRVEYGNLGLTINEKKLYKEYKDKIGDKIECELFTKYYDDGTTRSYLRWDS